MKLVIESQNKVGNISDAYLAYITNASFTYTYSVIDTDTDKIVDVEYAYKTRVEGTSLYIDLPSTFSVDSVIDLWFKVVKRLYALEAVVHLQTDSNYKAYLIPVSEDGNLRGKYEWMIEGKDYLAYFDTLQSCNYFHGNLEDCTYHSTRIGYDTSTTTDTPINFIVMLKPLGVALETTADNLEATLARLTQLQEAYDKLIEND